VIDPATAGELPAAIRAVAPAGVDYVLDTTGNAKVLDAVPLMLAPRGTFGFVGIPSSLDVKLPGALVHAMVSGFTYRGITEGDSDIQTYLPQLMRLHLDGKLPFDRLVKTYPLARINDAMRDQHDGLCVKAVLIP
jgi:aryl-alcohol dehydrogenase